MPLSKDKAWVKGRNKNLTGFCNDNGKPGQHEGTKPKDWRGRPMPTCEFWDTCPCTCHQSVDKMFEMTGLERKLMPNPEYVPERGNFVIPVMVDSPLETVAVTSDDVSASLDVETVAIAPPRAAQPALVTRRTETGRAARGGLEAQVWEACHELKIIDPLTPKIISEWIVGKYKIPTPSTGAINAVWERWVKLGYCEIAKKPNRFVKFTGDGSWEELARIKGATKRQKKNSISAARRGFR